MPSNENTAVGENAASNKQGSQRSKRTRQQQQPTHQTIEPTTAQQQGGGQQPDEEVSPFAQILNWVILFFLMQNVAGVLVNKFMPQEDSNNNNVQKVPNNNDNVQTVPDVDSKAAIDTKKTKPIGVTENNYQNWGNKLKPSCLWQMGTHFDLDVLITDSATVPDGWPGLTTPDNVNDNGENILAIESSKKKKGTILATWHQEDLILGGLSNGQPDTRNSFMSFLSSNSNQEMNHRNATLTIPMTQSIWNNETHVYAYVKLQRRRNYKGPSKDTSKKSNRPVRKDDVLVKRMMLTRYRKRKKMRDVKSLLDTPTSSVDSGDDIISSSSSLVDDPNDTSVLTTASLNKTHEQLLLYIKPSLTLQVVDMGKIDFPTKESIPKGFSNHMDWYRGEEDKQQQRPPMQALYYPILYQSEFWITFASLKEVNGTMKESKLDVQIEPVSVSIHLPLMFLF